MPIINGTLYNEKTPQAVIDLLERARHSGERLRLHYGDTETGRDWLEEYNMAGTISRSTGSIKIPLVVANARSAGGPGLLEHCIVKVRAAKGGRVLYEHPRYHVGEVKIGPGVEINGHKLPVAVYVDGKVHAQFASDVQARRWLAKMGLHEGRV